MAWVDKLLKHMMEQGASDLHCSSHNVPVIRVDGGMRPVANEAVISAEDMTRHMKEIAPSHKWEEFQKTNDTDFAYALPNIGRFRTNYFMDHKGPGFVCRLIPSKVPTLESLKTPEILKKFCELKKGLIIVTGPTGSGKSTTLAAMIDYINRHRDEHLITIEDPIEFVYENNKCLINQREVHIHTQSFKKALRAALREDPDIVLIGEMRDLETVEIALETAETGHLVFATLHTNTAASTINRIIDQFPADKQAQIRAMLADTLKGVVTQTLCRKIGGGRCAAQEILVVNSAVSANIRDGKTHQIPNAIQVGKNIGMQSLNDALIQRVQEGVIDVKECKVNSVDKQDMQMKLAAMGLDEPIKDY